MLLFEAAGGPNTFYISSPQRNLCEKPVRPARNTLPAFEPRAFLTTPAACGDRTLTFGAKATAPKWNVTLLGGGLYTISVRGGTCHAHPPAPLGPPACLSAGLPVFQMRCCPSLPVAREDAAACAVANACPAGCRAVQTLGTGGCQKYVAMPKAGSQCPEMVLQAASASEAGFAAGYFSSFRLVDRLGSPPGKAGHLPC